MRLGLPAQPPHGNLWQTSSVVAAWAVTAAQPDDATTTDWLSHVMYLSREAQERDDNGMNGMGVLQELYTKLRGDRAMDSGSSDH